MEDSDHSAISSAFRSAADIRKATTKCLAPRHILYFQNESTHFTHPPFTDNVERYLIENVISTTTTPSPPPSCGTNQNMTQCGWQLFSTTKRISCLEKTGVKRN